MKPTQYSQRRQFFNWLKEKYELHHVDLEVFVNKKNCWIWSLVNSHEINEKQVHLQTDTVYCSFSFGGIIGLHLFWKIRPAKQLKSMMSDVGTWRYSSSFGSNWKIIICHKAGEIRTLFAEKFPKPQISGRSKPNRSAISWDVFPLKFFKGYIDLKVYYNKLNSVAQREHENFRKRRGN